MMDPETQALFQAETQGLVESLEAGLLALQEQPDDRGLVDRVFRDLHTLKGTGGMFGQAELAQFVHDFESAFEGVRSGRLAASPALIAIALRAHDHVVALLTGTPPDGGEAILADLSRLLSAPAGPAPGWCLHVRLPDDTLALGGRPEIVLDELRALGATQIRALVAHVPPPEEIEPDALHLAWEVELPADVPEEAIREVFLFHDGAHLRLERPPLAAPAGPAAAAAAAQAPAAVPTRPAVEPAPAVQTSDTPRAPALMRVSAERLDDMMDRVGELVIAEARLSDIAGRSRDPALLAVAEDIQRLATGMRDTTMSIRMTPLGSITGRFKRLVHDLSGSLGKPIDLVFQGEETELDKTVVEQLADPLLHLIRNAVDHGIEEPADRLAAGKPSHGRITLTARHSGAEVLIALGDDGRGLDAARIRTKAVERGLLSPDAHPSEAELFPLIFEAGFSTAVQVTELSGRGVGMDVVRRTVARLRGSVEVTSGVGKGTSVTLRLPLTLAIIDGLLVDVAGERFTIPLAAVDEIVELPDDAPGGGARFLDIRGRLVPYLPLRALFASAGEPGAFQKVVVVTAGDTRVGLVVDRIIGSTQTVIKQLSPLHAALSIFSGATILGDGTVALILDVPNLVAQARGRGGVERRGEEMAA